MIFVDQDVGSTALVIETETFRPPFTVAVAPGSACTMSVEVSFDSGRNYADWVHGDVTAAAHATTAVGNTPTHIRVTRTAGSASSYVVISS